MLMNKMLRSNLRFYQQEVPEIIHERGRDKYQPIGEIGRGSFEEILV